MPTCPHCGDTSAPPKGWCLACGERVDGAAATRPAAAQQELSELPTDAIAFDDLEPIPASAPPAPPADGPPPLRLSADREPDSAPILAPVDTDEIEFAPAPVAPARPVPVRTAGRAAPPAPAAMLTPVPVAAPVGVPAVPAVPAAAEPHASIQLAARYEFSAVPGDETPVLGVLVEMTIGGRPLRAHVAGPVAHVILALDVSASMNVGSKYPVLEEAVAQFLADLHGPTAAPVLVSVVVFAKGAAILFEGVPAARLTAEAVHAAIRTHPLTFTRYTDVAGALRAAGRIARDQCRLTKTLPVRIYLMTDGRPQDMPAAREVSTLLANIPCDMHALAFGRDADVRALQELFAGRRGGTVKSVRRETLGEAFERIAEVAQRVVATRCQVSLELAAGVVGGAAFRYRPARVRFPDPAFAAGKRFAADLGTIESDRPYSLLFELKPPETSEPVSALGTLVVRIPGFGGPVEQTLVLAVARSSPGSEPGDVEPLVRTARDILDAIEDQDPAVALRALKLRRQIYEAERRDPGLLAILDRAIELIAKTGSLEGLSAGEQATLRAHTCTAAGDSAPRSRTGTRDAAPPPLRPLSQGEEPTVVVAPPSRGQIPVRGAPPQRPPRRR